MNLNIKAALEYIENHLQETIDLEACANAAHMSLMQLYREFYSVTGHSLKDYIRKRRISNVCFDLKYTRNSVLDIALENGFSMSSSLNKVFKRTVGVTPIEYRSQELYYFFPTGLDHDAKQRTYPVKVENMEEIPGLCCSYYTENAVDIEKQAIAALRDTLKSASNQNIHYRIFGKTSLGSDSPGNRYQIFIATGQPNFFPAELKKTGFSEIGYASKNEGPYACITVLETDNINNAWDFLYHNWLLGSMFYCEEKVCYEEYVFKKNREIKELRLYLPIAKKDAINRITIRTEPDKQFITCKQDGPDAEEKAIEIFTRWAKSRQIHDNQAYYIACRDDQYECGMPYSDRLIFSEDKEIRLKYIPAGLYATYSQTNYGNVSALTNLMVKWLQSDPLYTIQGESFAVYYTTGDCVKMELFLPVKKSC